MDLVDSTQGEQVFLSSTKADVPISEASELALRCGGWSSEDEAADAGERYAEAMVRSLARAHMAVDLGTRAPTSLFTRAGLEWVESQVGRRALNDVHGLQVFETEPAPLFVGSQVQAVRTVQSDRFHDGFLAALELAPPFSPREKLSFDFYADSFFAHSADARFTLLFIAVEALLEDVPRPDSSLKHVDQLLADTASAPDLNEAERSSLTGALEWLRLRSIRQGGKDLAERLGDRQYAGRAAKRFFTDCYELRNRLVHGRLPTPTRAEVDGAAAGLEVFVGHLLAGPLIDLEL